MADRASIEDECGEVWACQPSDPPTEWDCFNLVGEIRVEAQLLIADGSLARARDVVFVDENECCDPAATQNVELQLQ